MNPTEFSQSYYDAINHRDLGFIISLFDNDATLYFPSQGEYNGRDAILTFFRDVFFQQFVKIEFRDLTIVQSRESIAIKAYVTGTVSNAKSFDQIRYFEFLELKDGHISRSEICIDMPALRAQVGKW
ncbi:MAG: nuclear transport factor 2 family protein [Thaumarchaeota archaeon]|nr:nuclear transport factor 2 family protein [Nitrososphaerota archaeon]